MTPLLSILICGVPRRIAMAQALIAELQRQLAECERISKDFAAIPPDVEVLYLLDNKKRTIGAKRQAMLEMAQGEFVSFVDDDDWITEDYIPQIVVAKLGEAFSPDVIVFPVRCTINGKDEGLVEMSVKYAPKDGEPLEEYRPLPAIVHRPPHEIACWRRELAIQSRFADTSQGEEFLWAAPLWPLVKSEVRIDKPIYWWRHNIEMREHHEEPA